MEIKFYNLIISWCRCWHNLCLKRQRADAVRFVKGITTLKTVGIKSLTVKQEPLKIMRKNFILS
jgi:hypothetical protein